MHYAVDYFTNGAINTQVHCTYSIQNEYETVEMSWHRKHSDDNLFYKQGKTFNIQKFEYGLIESVCVTYALSLSFQRLRRHADAYVTITR